MTYVWDDVAEGEVADPGQINELGQTVEDHDATLAAITQAVGETVGQSDVTFTTTETLIDSITFTSAGPSARYELAWSGNLVVGAANDTIRFRMRYKAGATLDSAGTAFHNVRRSNNSTSDVADQYLVRTVTGIPAGQTTIGVLGVRDAGTGTATIQGAPSTQERMLTLKRTA